MKPITNCRACGSHKLKDFLDLGEQRISDFRETPELTPAYPLVAVYCEDCHLVQLRHSTPQSEMYHENYGFKSGISDSIKDDLKDIVFHAQQWFDTPKRWLDIASNDGTLLSYVPTACYRVGIDPIKFLCEEAKQHADLIINGYFDIRHFVDYEDSAKFDVITSISCFYDMPDPNKFVSDVKGVMHDDSVWVIQQNYLLPTLELGALDNFCHEHLEYYTLLSLENLLEKHGLEVFDLSTSMVNGGSIRTLVAKKGTYPVQDIVERQRTIEIDARLTDFATYESFGSAALANINKLRQVIEDYNRDGKTVYILAASTRGSTIWQACGFGGWETPFAVERNPAKVGRYFSAIGIPIISEEQARKDKPDAMIVGPWFFKDEIINREAEYIKNGGHLIFPLPQVEICKN